MLRRACRALPPPNESAPRRPGFVLFLTLTSLFYPFFFFVACWSFLWTGGATCAKIRHEGGAPKQPNPAIRRGGQRRVLRRCGPICVGLFQGTSHTHSLPGRPALRRDVANPVQRLSCPICDGVLGLILSCPSVSGFMDSEEGRAHPHRGPLHVHRRRAVSELPRRRHGDVDATGTLGLRDGGSDIARFAFGSDSYDQLVSRLNTSRQEIRGSTSVK